MGEPEGDDKPEQAAREIANKQESDELLSLKRKDLLATLFIPNNLLGIFGAYVAFVGTFVGFGVLAFYTAHKTIQEVVFFISAALFLIPLVGAVWYVRPFFIKKSAIRKLMDRIIRSSLSTLLAQLGNNRFFRLFNLALNMSEIAFAIYSFPRHPQWSLAIVVIYLALSFGLLTAWTYEALAMKIYTTLDKVVDLNEWTFHRAIQAYDLAEGARDFIQGTESSHQEAHQTVIDALKAAHNHTAAVQESVRAVADAVFTLPNSAVETDSDEDGIDKLG